MRVFVTGGNGFIGSVVVRRLVGAGHDVLCLLRRMSRTERIDDLAFERVDGDIGDAAVVSQAMEACGATIHLAAPGGWDADDPAVLDRVIVGGTHNVLASASRLSDHRVVIVSSAAAIACSDAPRVFDESAAFDSIDSSLHYSHAKHRAELLAREASDAGVDVVIVNPTEVYGPGDSELVTARNLIDFATAYPVFVCDGGTSVVHVDDVAAGILAALETGCAGERYILGGENLTIRELAKTVLDLSGRRAPIVRLPSALLRGVTALMLRARVPMPFNPHVVPYATRYWFMSNEKARDQLGLTFRGARETIGSAIAWLESAGHLTPHPGSARSPIHVP